MRKDLMAIFWSCLANIWRESSIALRNINQQQKAKTFSTLRPFCNRWLKLQSGTKTKYKNRRQKGEWNYE
jgi:predicted DNA-binding ribbon-helix-helix protein